MFGKEQSTKSIITNVAVAILVDGGLISYKYLYTLKNHWNYIKQWHLRTIWPTLKSYSWTVTMSTLQKRTCNIKPVFKNRASMQTVAIRSSTRFPRARLQPSEQQRVRFNVFLCSLQKLRRECSKSSSFISQKPFFVLAFADPYGVGHLPLRATELSYNKARIQESGQILEEQL
ncbi:hypothetical protein QWT69_00840 [Sporosarcina oncorhynchi]|uniref:Uncharacterized protein n=1 Tax=Sporosarcina oncorhynchi TaxID=3056444 RepID=A0ABZ0L551_9BACL|nr:hypothetical protein [Sporosarcina sp. T2O-4]WOV87700.1 hypothetical protein QWT69_00840 [Sporosarcina sp. T2O-4]